METFNNIIDFITNITLTLGPLFGILLIILESIIPALPLAVFISLNIITFGAFFGFVISCFATVLGCILSYYLVRKGFSDKLYKHIKEDGKISLFLKNTKKLSFPNLVLLMAMPFTPAFAVNIAAGLSKMDFKKFLLALLISKPFMVYFWGYVGKTLIESVQDPLVILRIAIILLIAYFLSQLIQIKFKIKEE